MAQHIISYLEANRFDTMGFEKVGQRTTAEYIETPLYCTLSWKGGSQWTIKSVSDTARSSDSKP